MTIDEQLAALPREDVSPEVAATMRRAALAEFRASTRPVAPPRWYEPVAAVIVVGVYVSWLLKVVLSFQ